MEAMLFGDIKTIFIPVGVTPTGINTGAMRKIDEYITH